MVHGSILEQLGLAASVDQQASVPIQGVLVGVTQWMPTATLQLRISGHWVLNVSVIVGGSHSVLIGADVLDKLLRGAGCAITSADASAAAKREAGVRLMRRAP